MSSVSLIHCGSENEPAGRMKLDEVIGPGTGPVQLTDGLAGPKLLAEMGKYFYDTKLNLLEERMSIKIF